MKTLFASALLASAQGAPLSGERDLTGYTFDDYMNEFRKTYNGMEEHASRKTTFQENLMKIKEHNAIDGKSWFVTVNSFTDMTNDEFRKMTKGGRKQIPTELTEAFVMDSNVDLPDRLDWREKDGIVTPVKDQGCGDCWAFSATETFESHLALATGSKAQVLSPQQIVSCSKNPKDCGGSGGCQGATQPIAFQYTKTAGLTALSDYPYRGQTGTCDKDKIKPVGFNTGLTELAVNNYTQLIQAVATKGPIAISLDAGGFFENQAYGGGVVSCGTHSYDMDHAVQLVGYGTDGGKDYWLVRNSWGQDWGESGYIRLQRFGEGKEPCGIDKTPQDGDACKGDTKPRTYCGSCGILSASSYPTGMRKAGSPTEGEVIV